LRRQLEQGAPADVFASANNTELAAVIEAGLIADGTPHVFARNRLTVIVPKDNRAGVDTLADLAKPRLKIVLAASNVPVGGYALSVLEKMNQEFGATFSATVLSNVGLGTPLAYSPARRTVHRTSRSIIETLLDLPIVLPPAVAGLALLMTFGRRGLVGPLLAGVILTWARALGEFGATILFAGNFAGCTQAMPLAIYRTLESNLGAAVAMAALLIFIAVVFLLALRVVTHGQCTMLNAQFTIEH
jgi:ABC-type molybdate transport system permease subunit